MPSSLLSSLGLAAALMDLLQSYSVAYGSWRVAHKNILWPRYRSDYYRRLLR